MDKLLVLSWRCVFLLAVILRSTYTHGANVVVEWYRFDTTRMEDWNAQVKDALTKTGVDARRASDVHAKYLAILKEKRNARVALRLQVEAEEGKPVPVEATVGTVKFTGTLKVTRRSNGRFIVTMRPSIVETDNESFSIQDFAAELRNGETLILTPGPLDSVTNSNGSQRRTTTVRYLIVSVSRDLTE